MKFQLTRIHDQMWEFTYRSIPFLLIDDGQEGFYKNWPRLIVSTNAIKLPDEVGGFNSFLQYWRENTYFNPRGVGKNGRRELWLSEVLSGYLEFDSYDVDFLDNHLEQVSICNHIRLVNSVKEVLTNEANSYQISS